MVNGVKVVKSYQASMMDCSPASFVRSINWQLPDAEVKVQELDVTDRSSYEHVDQNRL
jgi:hypothetical protein